MRTFAQKPNRPQQPASIDITRPHRTALPANRGALRVSDSHRFGHDFSQIPVHAPSSENARARLGSALAGAYEQEVHRNNLDGARLAIQKRSLEVSSPTDADEKEAEEVARKVADGQQVEIHRTGRRLESKAEGSTETTPEFQSKLERSKNGGQSLDATTRREMESKMGADFSAVKIHTGSAAHDMNESLNATAFTQGQNVFFRAGKFNANSQAGQELLAHELTHTAQNQRKPSLHIQRKITVQGQPFPIPEALRKEIAAYHALALGTLNAMERHKYTFDFDSEIQLQRAVHYRTSLIEGLTKANLNSQNQYGDTGQLKFDHRYWEEILRDAKGNVVKYRLITEGKDALSPAEAIDRIVLGGDMMTISDCSTMMMAIQKWALRQTIGEDEFNKKYENKDFVVSPLKLDPDAKLFRGDDLAAGAGYKAGMNEADRKKVEATSLDQLIPGDRVYFQNFLEYKTDYGYWQGEHALYMGRKGSQETGEQLFSGFGAAGLTYDDMIEKLIKKFNDAEKLYRKANKNYKAKHYNKQMTPSEIYGVDDPSLAAAYDTAPITIGGLFPGLSTTVYRPPHKSLLSTQ